MLFSFSSGKKPLKQNCQLKPEASRGYCLLLLRSWGAKNLQGPTAQIFQTPFKLLALPFPGTACMWLTPFVRQAYTLHGREHESENWTLWTFTAGAKIMFAPCSQKLQTGTAARKTHILYLDPELLSHCTCLGNGHGSHTFPLLISLTHLHHIYISRLQSAE